jgi:hypothetical protein
MTDEEIFGRISLTLEKIRNAEEKGTFEEGCLSAKRKSLANET